MPLVALGATTDEQVTWAAANLRAGDMLSTNYTTAALIGSVTNCIRQLKYTLEADTAAAIAAAQAAGITRLGYHPEGMSVAQLVTSLGVVYPQMQAAGMTMMFVPNATKLEEGFEYFDTLCDELLYATQKYQALSTWPASPRTYFGLYKSERHSWPIDIQISTNPPAQDPRGEDGVYYDFVSLSASLGRMDVARWWVFFDADDWATAQAVYERIIATDTGVGLEDALYMLLWDCCSGRIYPGVIPADAALPALAYQRISGPRILAHDGPSGLAGGRYQFVCTAATYAAAKTLANDVRVALDGYRGNLSGVEVERAAAVNEMDGYNQTTAGFTVRLDFEINYKE